jgi:hypothetical protein
MRAVKAVKAAKAVRAVRAVRAARYAKALWNAPMVTSAPGLTRVDLGRVPTTSELSFRIVAGRAGAAIEASAQLARDMLKQPRNS